MAIADEQTTGTWIKVSADSAEKTRRFGSKLVALYEVPDIGCDYQSDEPPMYIIQIAYPMENFSNSMSSLMTILFGNISASGMIRLIDVAFPKKLSLLSLKGRNSVLRGFVKCWKFRTDLC